MLESDFQTFEAVGALVVVLEVDGRIVYWNQACSLLTGYSLPEVRGRLVWDFLLLPEEVDAVIEVFTNMRTTEVKSAFANYWVTKTGERRWIAWSHTMSAGPTGPRQYLIKTGIDRTDEKRDQNALRIAEARLSGIIEIAADAIISIDDAQRIVLYNLGAERIFGWSAAEVMGRPLDMLLPASCRGGHSREVRAFGSGQVKARQMAEREAGICGLRKDGEEFPAQAAISKFVLDGRTWLTVVLRDVTEQRQQEKERAFLSRVGATLAATIDYDEMLTSIERLIVEDLADLCIVDLFDSDGKLQRTRVVHRDPAKAELCRTLERIPIDRGHPSLAAAVIESQQPTLIVRVSQEYLESIARSEEHRRALSELAPQSLMAVPLLTTKGLQGSLVFVSTQPSHRYGQADLRLAQELAYRAALAVGHARLYKEARHAAQMRDDVLGTVAHDLRSPLSTILLQTSLLQRRRQANDQQSDKPLETIHRVAQRMNRLIQDLLDVTQIDAGKLSLARERVSSTRMVLDTVESQRLRATQSHIEIILEAPDGLPEIWADRDRVMQLLENLFGNALKFTAAGGRITIRARPGIGEVLFSVADTGPGIAPEELPHLFERFWQSGKADRRGAGLGLAIVKGLVESHGGRIWVESTLGVGTTFWLTIPTAPPDGKFPPELTSTGGDAVTVSVPDRAPASSPPEKDTR